jgi:antitoxin VapB
MYSLSMALNIKNPEVEKLAAEVAGMTGESKTQAIRKALVEYRNRLGCHVDQKDRRAKLLRFLEQEVWPKVPRRALGKRLTKKQRVGILGYGPRGI